MKAVDKVLNLALAEVGYLEKASIFQLDDKTANAGNGNWTKYARDLDAIGFFNGKKQGYSWCAVYAIWPFVEAFGAALTMKLLGLPKKSSAAGVKSLAGYFKAAGRFFAAPQPGDFIFFYTKDLTGWAHVGLVERVEDGKVYTVEGNTSGASGVVSNGGGVARKSYALTYNRIAGYGRPNWGLVPAEEEENEKGEETMYNTIEEIEQHEPWAAPTVRKLIARGAIAGTTGQTDENGFPVSLALDYTTLRVLVIHDRMGLYGD